MFDSYKEYVVSPTIEVARLAVILVSGSGFAQFKMLIALLIFEILSTED
jgi:hypothetical protein